MALTSKNAPRPDIIAVFDNYLPGPNRLHWYGEKDDNGAAVLDWWSYPSDLIRSVLTEVTVHWEERRSPTHAGMSVDYYLAHIAEVAYFHARVRDWSPDVPGVQHSNGIQYHYYIADGHIFQVSPETLRTWNAFDANGRNIAICMMAGPGDVSTDNPTGLNIKNVVALQQLLDWLTTGRADLPLITARPQQATALRLDGTTLTQQTFGVLTHDETLVKQGRPTKGCPGPYGNIVAIWREAHPQNHDPFPVIGPPTISLQVFGDWLKYRQSPILAERPVADFYNACIDAGVNPAIALAFFDHENKCGTAGVALAARNWGSMRPRTWMKRNVLPDYHATGPNGEDYGMFAQYRAWYDGLLDWLQKMKMAPYAGLSVEQITPIYAPKSDRNDPAAYAKDVLTLAGQWQQQSQG